MIFELSCLTGKCNTPYTSLLSNSAFISSEVYVPHSIIPDVFSQCFNYYETCSVQCQVMQLKGVETNWLTLVCLTFHGRVVLILVSLIHQVCDRFYCDSVESKNAAGGERREPVCISEELGSHTSGNSVFNWGATGPTTWGSQRVCDIFCTE